MIKGINRTNNLLSKNRVAETEKANQIATLKNENLRGIG